MELSWPLMAFIATIAIIAGIALGAWYVIGLYWLHSRKEEKELQDIELPANLHEVFTGVPPVLIIFYIFMFVFSIAYVIYIWLGGLSY